MPSRTGLPRHNTVLEAGQSAALRDKLLAEVATLTSAEFAVTWATRALPAKNSLIAADAKLLEDGFEQKLSSLPSPVVNAISAGQSAKALEVTPQEEPQASHAANDRSRGIDKSVLAVAAPRRYRNREHLRYVAQQPCLVCGRKPSDPIIFGTCSHARSAAKRATNSRSRCAECITARSIAPATSAHGGRPPASTRSRSHASFGGAHA